MPLDFESIFICSVGDLISIQCNNASSDQSFTCCQLFIQQVINDFNQGTTLAGLTDVTPNATNNYVLAYNSATSKYVSQSANSANLVDKSSGQIVSGQKQFSGSTTVCMINSSSPQIPLQVSNALGNTALQLTSGTTSSYIAQQADDMIFTNAVDSLPSVRISQTHLFNQFGRQGFENILYANNHIQYYDCDPSAPILGDRRTIYNTTTFLLQNQHYNGTSWVTGSTVQF